MEGYLPRQHKAGAFEFCGCTPEEETNMVKILANSACDLTPEMARQCGLTLIPDIVVFSPQEQYRNTVDIDAQEFYRRLPSCQALPTTAHPNLEQYMQAFASVGECDEILCISLTSKMSGAYSTACAARQLMMDQNFPIPITIYDTLEISFGMGILVKEACRMAREGKNVQQIVAELERIRQKVGVYFVMETLEYAKKGGRVGAIRVLAADLLGVKPILMFRDGLVRDIGIVRGYRNGLERVISLYETKAKFGGEVFVFHADRPELAQEVKERLFRIDPLARIQIGWVGSVIGVYTGAGALGIAFMEA